MFYSLVNLPSATTTFANIGSYSSAMFDELLPLAWLSIGFFVGSIIVVFIIRMIPAAFSRLFLQKRGLHGYPHIDD